MQDADDAAHAEAREARQTKVVGGGGFSSNDFKDALVVWADDAVTLHVQCPALTQARPGADAELKGLLTVAKSSFSGTPVPTNIKPGMFVAAKSSDGEVYRAKVKRVTKQKGASAASVVVDYVDMGNSETVPIAHVRTCDVVAGSVPAHDGSNPSAIPFLSRKVTLAFARPPRKTDSAYTNGPGVVSELLRSPSGNKVKLAVVAKNDAATYVIVVPVGEAVGEYHSPAAAGATLQGKLIAKGLAAVAEQQPALEDLPADVRKNTEEFVEALRPLQQAAVSQRDPNGMWRHGDLGDDDEY